MKVKAKDKAPLEAACRKLGVNPATLWDYKVYPGDRVVIIISTGQKHTFPLADLDLDEPPVSDVDPGAAPPPVTFEGLLWPRVAVILQEAGLLDPVVLRKLPDTDLIAVPGIGPKTAEHIREVLEEFEKWKHQPSLL